jgi:hypothetical protein
MQQNFNTRGDMLSNNSFFCGLIKTRVCFYGINGAISEVGIELCVLLANLAKIQF